MRWGEAVRWHKGTRRSRMTGVMVLLAACLSLGTPIAAVDAPAITDSAREDSATSDAAESGTIVGRVTKQGKPYPYTNVIVLGTRMGTQTSHDGWFALERVPAGKQVLLVQAIWCEKQSLTVSLRLRSSRAGLVPKRGRELGRWMHARSGGVHRGCLLRRVPPSTRALASKATRSMRLKPRAGSTPASGTKTQRVAASSVPGSSACGRTMLGAARFTC
jgi:hypothetical protein